MEVPWWALSPSPFSIIFYLILITWTIRGPLKKAQYRHWQFINRATESFFMVGFIVLLTDLMWVIGSGLRFGSAYSDSIFQLVMCAGRDIAGAGLCYLMVSHRLNLNKGTILGFILNGVFLTVWFALASSPAYVDWTFAIRYGYSAATIWTDFLVSHVLGRIIVTLIYWTAIR